MMSDWLPIDTAPKDGTAIFGWEDADRGNQWPVVIKWTEHTDPEDAEEYGDGFWQYCEELLSDVAIEAYPTHWMSLPGAPK